MKMSKLINLYSKFNIPWLKYFAIKMLEISHRRFLVVRLDTNFLCNLKCRMCYFSNPEIVKKKTMDLSLFKKIAEDIFSRTRFLYMSCGSEPFMTRNFLEYVKLAKAYGIPYLSFVTNGTLLNEEMISEIVDIGVNEVIISLDGAQAKTFENIRRGANYDKVTENIRLFKEVKERKNKNLPLIRLNYVLMKSNVNEIQEFFQIISQYNIDAVNFREIMYFDTDDKNFYSEEQIVDQEDIYNKVKKTIQENASLYNINTVVSIGCQKQVKECKFRKYECQLPWFNIQADCEGNYRICVYHEWVGNFNEKSYWDTMKSKEIKEIKKRLATNPKKSCLLKCFYLDQDD